ncbi:hypothetical protein NEUTE1DRAFT_99963 [Neurospora tetrasperma FGSC 2508]|uniref:Uncharacterized protein n=1 Tax=Neurospora tetrasperma (strain FGSC 2508 / ATCC MYA-4615 / P0657) TaxID=510951 RepID=F8MIL3_NEUT8|nr:uncharacterized protein NEUTE1DRAFT_99963 [Neurospora tetrasperma FGSC 2508]EGO59814.1 hypothetical protein NEUTE1DRAFT_99963 [Neurospora tetrasperma FGSC 2508]
MPSKTRKKEKQRAKQTQKQDGMKHLQQQESTPTSPTPFPPSSPATQPVNHTQMDHRRVHTTLLQIKKLFTNSTDTTQALLSFLNSLVRFPDTLPCCHGGEHSSNYRHIWPHSPLEDLRAEGEEVQYWIRYLDLIKQWELRRQEAQSWMKYYDSILGRMMEMQRGEAVVDRRVQEEERKRELEERRCQSTIDQLLVIDAEARKLSKKCIKGSEGTQPHNEAQNLVRKPDVRLSLDICRYLFKQLVPPDLDEEEHEMSAEPCRLTFNQIIMTNADARQLIRTASTGSKALRVGWTEKGAVEDGVGEDEDEDHQATSYDWMKDLMSADKIEGEDGEIPVGLSEYWRYSKAYLHLYLVISRISSLRA